MGLRPVIWGKELEGRALPSFHLVDVLMSDGSYGWRGAYRMVFGNAFGWSSVRRVIIIHACGKWGHTSLVSSLVAKHHFLRPPCLDKSK
jgi:hypothetical protein